MNKLTNKQSLFAKHYALGKSGRKAAILAGYSERSAEAIASENLRKPEVLKKINGILESAGLGDKALAKKLKKAIDSGLGKRANNSDALRGIRMAYELKDRFPDAHTRMEVTQTSQIDFKLQAMTTEELEDYMLELTIKTKEYLERIQARQQDSESENNVSDEGVVVEAKPSYPKAESMPYDTPLLQPLK